MSVASAVAAAVSVRDLVVRVRVPDGVLTVLDHVDLEIEPGALVALVGPSGAGKTTLLNVIGGLEPDHLGTVLIDGEPVWSRPESARAVIRNRRIGFVFQNANLIQGLTAEENLIIPLLLRPGGDRAPGAIARDLLERCGLGSKARTRVERLSGGERQRVATARALIGEPGLLLVDEPTGNLDPENARRITELLLGYRTERDASMLIATHDERVIARADHVVRIENGVIGAAS